MKKIFVLLISVLVSSCFSNKRFQKLPDAEFNKPYFIRFDIADQATYPESFNVTIAPSNSGLSVHPINEWYDTVILSGTPKVKQDISIEIFYVIRGPVGFFEDYERENHYLIKVKE